MMPLCPKLVPRVFVPDNNENREGPEPATPMIPSM